MLTNVIDEMWKNINMYFPKICWQNSHKMKTKTLRLLYFSYFI